MIHYNTVYVFIWVFNNTNLTLPKPHFYLSNLSFGQLKCFPLICNINTKVHDFVVFEPVSAQTGALQSH